jgi:hypothetical protein
MSIALRGCLRSKPVLSRWLLRTQRYEAEGGGPGRRPSTGPAARSADPAALLERRMHRRGTAHLHCQRRRDDRQLHLMVPVMLAAGIATGPARRVSYGARRRSRTSRWSIRSRA